MTIEIKPVTDQSDIHAFHEIAHRLYQENEAWAPPFQFELENIFSKKDNPYFQAGECERFLVIDAGEVVGRFALMNHRVNDAVFTPKLAGMGFVELVNNQAVAEAMIQFAKVWHRKRGYTAMRGPINFGGIYNNWGLLIDNFEDPPVYGMPYHHPYYQTLFENTGAEKLEDIYSYSRPFLIEVPDRIQQIADYVGKKPEVSCRFLDVKNIEQDIRYIHEIYTKAWSEQAIEKRSNEFVEVSLDDMIKAAKQMKPIIQPEANLIAFVDGKPASFVTTLPDLNQLSTVTRGHLHWWQLLKLLRFKKQATRARVLIFGTVPEYRRMGLEALIYVKGYKAVRRRYPKMSSIDASWISEGNWLSQRTAQGVGFKQYKTHRTYRWIFDENDNSEKILSE